MTHCSRATLPATISWSKNFLPVKSEIMTFLHVSNMWDFSSFIEEGIKWQKVDNFFWNYHFSKKFSCHSCTQWFCAFVFFIRTFVKMHSKWYSYQKNCTKTIKNVHKNYTKQLICIYFIYKDCTNQNFVW